MLPKEQIPQIKKQIIQQINSTFPEEQKAQAIEQINSMDEEQLEQFLIQNNLVKDAPSRAGEQFCGSENSESITRARLGAGGTGTEGSPPNCIFCSIVSGQISSFQIDENKDAIAILELNPISQGHVLVIPKEHLSESSKIPSTIFTLAKKIAKKIKTKFKPKNIEISSSNLFGHEIVNVFPVYENENLNSQRQKTTPEELAKLQKQLEKKSKPKTIKKAKPKKVESEKLWLPKRFP